MKSPFINEILLEYDKTRDQKKKELEYRKEEIYDLLPRVAEIDSELAKLGIALSREILKTGQAGDGFMKHFRDQIESLKKEKHFLLQDKRLPQNFLEIQHNCTKCADTGFLKTGRKCSCFKQKIIERAYMMSGISANLEVQNFEHFNMDLFAKEIIPGEDISPHENIQIVLSRTQKFIADFKSNPKGHLLFYGDAGLGKTYLCNCIAKALLDEGHQVIYQTAFKITEILEDYKFQKQGGTLAKAHYQLLFDCDLLIIDDLGTEMPNTFTVSELFNIINTRLMQNKKIVISTNVLPTEFVQIYGDRIASRILSNFQLLKFVGDDLRFKG